MRQRVAAALVPRRSRAGRPRSSASGVACGAGGEVQPAAGGQVEAARERAGDHGRPRRRSQRLLERPQGVLVAPGLDQQQAAGIEAELDEPVAVGRAEIGEAAPLGDEHGGAGARMQRCSRQREEETECRGTVAMGGGGDLVQHAAGKAGARQMGMHLLHAERQICGLLRMRTLQPRHALAQGGDACRLGGVAMARRQRIRASRRRGRRGERNGVRPSVRHLVSVTGRAGGPDPIADLMPPSRLTPNEERAVRTGRLGSAFSSDGTHVKSVAWLA